MLTGRGFELFGASISSIQRGIYAGQIINDPNDVILYRDITISSVDLNKSQLICIGTGIAETDSYKGFSRAYLYNSTTIRVLRSYRRITSPSQQNSRFLPFAWQVIEFSNIKSIQRGTFDSVQSTNSTPIDIIISPVNINKAILNCIGLGIGHGDTVDYNGRAYLYDSTTIRVPYHGSYGSKYYWAAFTWEVIEFN